MCAGRWDGDSADPLGCFWFAQVEDSISQMLDDHIVMTQSMSFSQFKKPFEERISKWELQLSLVGAADLSGG